MIRLSVAAALLLAVACSNNDATSPQTQIPGTYTLRTVNGFTLPIVEPLAPNTSLLSDTLHVAGDGTFTLVTVEQRTDGNGGKYVAQSQDAGTWTSSGTTFVGTFAPGNGGGSASLTDSNGNTLSGTVQGYTVVFQR